MRAHSLAPESVWGLRYWQINDAVATTIVEALRPLQEGRLVKLARQSETDLAELRRMRESNT